MHISEKTEKNPIDKLMPGLFGDDEPEEELIEIVLDEDADTLAELAEPEDDEILIQPDEAPPKKRRRLGDLFSKKSGDDETP